MYHLFLPLRGPGSSLLECLYPDVEHSLFESIVKRRYNLGEYPSCRLRPLSIGISVLVGANLSQVALYDHFELST